MSGADPKPFPPPLSEYVERPRTGGRRLRRWLTWLALAVLVAAAAAFAISELVVTDAETRGPLRPYEASSIGLPTKVGQTGGYGLPVVFNPTGERLRIERVYPLSPTKGLRLVGTRVAGDRRTLMGVSFGPWPSRDFSDVRPLKGHTVPPQDSKAGRRGVELILLLAADRPGAYSFSRIAVEYELGGTMHRAVLRYGLRLCVARAPRTGGCEAAKI